MRKYLVLVALLFICQHGFALHIAGGELYYQYMGPGSTANTDRYIVTLRLFRECNPVTPEGQPAAAMPTEVELGIFLNKEIGGTPIDSIIVRQSSYNEITLNSPLVCIINPPRICYQIGYFSTTIELPRQPYGYTISYQTCCRSFSIQNVTFFSVPGQGTPGEGATYTCSIPGTIALGNEHNSSAVFAIKDTVLVCQFKKIKLDFSATDPDTKDTTYRDSLSYSFCSAYNKGASTSSANVMPSNPPYRDVTYNGGYSGSAPLGANIVIDAKTGIITGTVGAAGGYVVNVCVAEWRHGKVISVHRKDFLLRVTSCDFAAADLKPSYINCTDLTFHFQNESTSSAIHSYFWAFGDPHNNADTSNQPTPSYVYPDTGQYTIKLIINKDEECTDSTTALVKAYPGFKADMSVVGSCLLRPYDFIDKTVSKYGLVNKWLWTFGDGGSDSTQNPQHTYTAAATVNVSFTVSDSKGCTETVNKEVKVLSRPEIIMPFRDTLICKLDTLQVFASSNFAGAYTWSGTNISNPNTPNPYVYPRHTTKYFVAFDDGKGCVNTDSVNISVADSAIVHLGADTVICLKDTVQLIPVTNALKFTWQPPPLLNAINAKSPLVRPLTTTTYVVTATIGDHCLAKDDIVIAEIPYPEANAGPDITVCYGTSARLLGTIKGSSFTWSPAVSLYEANTLTPLAGPMATTTYTLTVYDTINKPNCPKPSYSYVTVKIPPPVVAAVVSDTNAVIGEPLQLTATGGNIYLWQPPTALNNPGIYNPVATYPPGSADSVTYQVTVRDANNCVGYTHATVHIFKTQPEIFVPTAFSPNGDGTNDLLKVVTAGIKQFDYFHVFNRWGNLVFTTTNPSQGWDGSFNGIKQPPGTYVFDAQGIDYIGRPIRRKGTVVLIR